MRYHILTLGCQMNISDSERIAQKLEELGYKSAPESVADLVIINACSVRQHAVDRIWGKIKKWTTHDRQLSKQVLITGCVVNRDQQKFINKKIIYFNIKDLPNLKKVLNNKKQTNKVIDDLSYFKILSFNKPEQKNKIAYIPIMTGCNNFCSYCAVPYTRGREVSRPMVDIISEVKRAVTNGYENIMLLGQNVNSYNSHNIDKADKVEIDNSEFIELLRTIDELPGDFKFNFISSNPHDMGDNLIECFTRLKKWNRELHLAMQSGDNEILKQMNRKYTGEQFLHLVKRLKSKIRNLKLSTDIIVGFPGETDNQFNNTFLICKKIGFTKAYISSYSPRPETAAAKLVDNVSKEVKKERWLILNNLINK